MHKKLYSKLADTKTQVKNNCSQLKNIYSKPQFKLFYAQKQNFLFPSNQFFVESTIFLTESADC